MNEETKKKIEMLAENLKKMHLSTTMEEAKKTAENIILSTIKEGNKSIREMMQESPDNEEDKKHIKEEKKEMENNLYEKEKKTEKSSEKNNC